MSITAKGDKDMMSEPRSHRVFSLFPILSRDLRLLPFAISSRLFSSFTSARTMPGKSLSSAPPVMRMRPTSASRLSVLRPAMAHVKSVSERLKACN